MFLKIGESLYRLKTHTLAFALFCVVIVKTGVSPIGSEFVHWIRETAKTYPDPVFHLVSSPLPIGIMKLFRYPNDLTWWGIGLAIYIFWIILSVKLIIKKYPEHTKEALLIFFASAPVAISATMIGHIDIFSLIGATIAVLSNLPLKVVIGALFAVGGNSDQALATLVCLTFLYLGGSSFAKKYLWQWVIISISAYLLLHLNIDVPSINDPKQVMLTDLEQVLPTTLGSWHLLIFSQMGLLWLPWLYMVIPTLINQRQKFFILLGAIIIPLALTMFILDGTRVGTTVGFICLLITLDEAYQKKFKSFANVKQKFYGIAFFILAITPTIIVGNQGILRLPIRKFLEQFNII